MAKSILKARRIRDARSIDRKRYISKLTNEQFEKLLNKFYKEARDNNFHTNFEEAIKNNGYYFLHPQREIAERILRSVFLQEKSNIYVSLTRQLGKTEVVAMVTEFCFEHYFEVFGKPLRVAVIAPEKGTATEVFRRVKNYIVSRESMDLAIDRSNEVENITGDRIQLYGIYAGHGGTIEGRTFDMLIRDEGHLGSDDIFLDQVLPTTNRTAGPIITIGNGGFADCYFYRGLKRGTDPAKNTYSFIYNFITLEPYMKDLARRGDKSSQRWLDATYDYVENAGGWKSLYVRKNILCEWMVNMTQFLSLRDFQNCAQVNKQEIGPKYFVSYDCAYKGMDRAVACVMDQYRNVLDFWVLKDIGDAVTFERQAETLRELCERQGILDNIVTLGVDTTGMGVGMGEAIEKVFPRTHIKRFDFTAKKKMEWYVALHDSVVAERSSHRIRINWGLFGYGERDGCIMKKEVLDMAIKEVCDIEIKPTQNGLITFHAPTAGKMLGKSMNDDFSDALVMALDLVGDSMGYAPMLGLSNSLRRQKERSASGGLFPDLASRTMFLQNDGPQSGLPTTSRKGQCVPDSIARLRKRARKGYTMS